MDGMGWMDVTTTSSEYVKQKKRKKSGQRVLTGQRKVSSMQHTNEAEHCL